MCAVAVHILVPREPGFSSSPFRHRRVVVTQIGMSQRGGAVMVRGGMFKTGDLEMKSTEAQLGTTWSRGCLRCLRVDVDTEVLQGCSQMAPAISCLRPANCWLSSNLLQPACQRLFGHVEPLICQFAVWLNSKIPPDAIAKANARHGGGSLARGVLPSVEGDRGQ